MLASSQESQDDKSLNSLFFPAIISVKDKYTMCVTKTTPFWIIDRTYSLVRARQSCAYIFLVISYYYSVVGSKIHPLNILSHVTHIELLQSTNLLLERVYNTISYYMFNNGIKQCILHNNVV